MNTNTTIKLLILALLTDISGALFQSAFADGLQTIQVQAKCYQYSPHEIRLKKGVPVILQITAVDKPHGFYVPDMNIDASAKPGKPAEVKVTPTKVGEFPFSCDVFCGEGHDAMGGKVIVTDK